MATNTWNLTEELPEEFYNEVIDKDRLTDEWLMTRTPLPVLSILSVYLLLVLKIGPKLMADREPYNVKSIMRVYNVCQMIVNALCVLKVLVNPTGVMCMVRNRCTIVDIDNCVEYIPQLLLYMWIYLAMKISDLMDTVFMVLRKKNSHITFLHVYHHVAMVLFTWICLTYVKSHHGIFPGFLNVIIHTIMYGYYFLATFQRLKKYLWWKRHLTKLQLIQFVLVLMYFAFLYRYNCHVSRIFTYIWVFNVAIICALFINFYIKAYTKSSESKDLENKQD